MIPYLAVISIILAISVAGESGPICSSKFSKPPGVRNMSRRARVDLALQRVSMLLCGQRVVNNLEIALERGEVSSRVWW